MSIPKVFNSPSFQDHNIGWGNYGTEEYRCNQIADVIDPILKDNGFTVGRNDPNKDIYGVIAQSNAFCGANDIHLSIHTNAGGGRGCTVFYFDGSAEGKRLAQSIYNEIIPLTPVEDRGIRPDKNYLELKNTKGIAVIVEVSFHDNEDDAKWIMDNIKTIGGGIARGVMKYTGVTPMAYDYKVLYEQEKQKNVELMQKIEKAKEALI
jgi:N-acetylmuramoyl-L-alanine amidase